MHFGILIYKKITIPQSLNVLGKASFQSPWIRSILRGNNISISEDCLRRAYGNQLERVEQEKVWDSLIKECCGIALDKGALCPCITYEDGHQGYSFINEIDYLESFFRLRYRRYLSSMI